jgi:DNA-directed RNA polymerase alpha subunit
MSPIAERAGRRVKILINNMNAELAANAAIEGVRELEQEVNKWSAVWVDELSIPFRWKELLKEQSITSVGDLLHMTDKQIMNKVPEFDDNVVFKISIALRRIGVHK